MQFLQTLLPPFTSKTAWKHVRKGSADSERHAKGCGCKQAVQRRAARGKSPPAWSGEGAIGKKKRRSDSIGLHRKSRQAVSEFSLHDVLLDIARLRKTS